MPKIKVEQVKEDYEYAGHTTFKNIFPTIFGVPASCEYHEVIDGVSISPWRENTRSYSMYGHKLIGIKMEAGSYPNEARRAVKIDKEGYIDSDVVLAKLDELKKIAAEDKVRQETYAKQVQTADELCQRVKRVVGAPDNWCEEHETPVQVYPYTPNTVRLEANVTGSQLAGIEKIAGTQKVNIALYLPEEDAIQICRMFMEGR